MSNAKETLRGLEYRRSDDGDTLWVGDECYYVLLNHNLKGTGYRISLFLLSGSRTNFVDKVLEFICADAKPISILIHLETYLNYNKPAFEQRTSAAKTNI